MLFVCGSPDLREVMLTTAGLALREISFKACEASMSTSEWSTPVGKTSVAE